MVFLAITPAGLVEAIRLAGSAHPVWCGADAITEEDFSANAAENLTRFDYSLLEPGREQAIAGALITIEEHHPGERVWVEHDGAL
jgi:hypothetical protein